MTEEEFLERQIPVHLNGKKTIHDHDRVVFGGSLEKKYVCIDDNSKLFEHYKEMYNPYAEKKPKDSQFFEYLFKKLRSKNSSFRTYLGDLPRGKNGHIPRYINCFVKDIRPSRGDEGLLGEIACPRLAELLNIDTIFNTAVEKESPYSDSYSYPEYINILSVDGTPEGYRFADFDEVGIIFNLYSNTLECAMLRIDMRLRHIAKEYGLLMDAPIVRKFKEDFIKQFFFKNILCEDEDFWESNIGLLIGNDGHFCMAPLFDFEHMFNARRSKTEYMRVAKEFFDYCRKYGHMNIVEDLMNRLNNMQLNGSMENVLNNSVRVKPYAIMKAEDLLNRNINLLNNEWKKVHSQDITM